MTASPLRPPPTAADEAAAIEAAGAQGPEQRLLPRRLRETLRMVASAVRALPRLASAAATRPPSTRRAKATPRPSVAVFGVGSQPRARPAWTPTTTSWRRGRDAGGRGGGGRGGGGGRLGAARLLASPFDSARKVPGMTSVPPLPPSSPRRSPRSCPRPAAGAAHLRPRAARRRQRAHGRQGHAPTVSGAARAGAPQPAQPAARGAVQARRAHRLRQPALPQPRAHRCRRADAAAAHFGRCARVDRPLPLCSSTSALPRLRRRTARRAGHLHAGVVAAGMSVPMEVELAAGARRCRR